VKQKVWEKLGFSGNPKALGSQGERERDIDGRRVNQGVGPGQWEGNKVLNGTAEKRNTYSKGPPRRKYCFNAGAGAELGKKIGLGRRYLERSKTAGTTSTGRRSGRRLAQGLRLPSLR